MEFYADAFNIRKYVATQKINEDKSGENQQRDLVLVQATKLTLKTPRGREIFDNLVKIWPNLKVTSDDNIKRVAKIFDQLYNLEPAVSTKKKTLLERVQQGFYGGSSEQTIGGISQGLADAYSIFVDNELPEDIAFIKDRKKEIQKRINEIKLSNSSLEDQIVELSEEIINLSKESKKLSSVIEKNTNHFMGLGYNKEQIKAINEKGELEGV
jgi:hypothetical protein